MSDGYGFYYFSNGDRFEGEWKNGMIYGYGIFYSSLGFKYKAFFKNTRLEMILSWMYNILLFINHLYSIFIRNKITLLFIIILIIALIIN